MILERFFSDFERFLAKHSISLFNQILHPKHPKFPNKELRRSNGSHGKALAVEGLVGKGEAVGFGVGHHAVDAVHLALAGHINI